MSSSFPKGSHAAIFSKHKEGGNNTETDTKSTTKSKRSVIIIIKKTFGALIGSTSSPNSEVPQRVR